MIGTTAMLVSLGMIFFSLVIWQVVTKRDSAKDLNNIAELTASILFWGVVIAVVLVVVFYS
jgi:heme/copper-type cytochrome/quinol oxidase subunit 3